MTSADSSVSLQEVLSTIAGGFVTCEEILSELSTQEQSDRHVMTFLRAIMAWQLHSKQELYCMYVPGMAAYCDGPEG